MLRDEIGITSLPFVPGKSHSKRLKMTQREAEDLVKTAADSQTNEEEPSTVAPSIEGAAGWNVHIYVFIKIERVAVGYRE